MVAREYINPLIPSLTLSDTALRALDLMEENKVAHLPVVSEGKYKGLISENRLMDLLDLDTRLDQVELEHIQATVFADRHWYEVLSIAYTQQLTVVPIIERDESFAGCVGLTEMLKASSQTMAVQQQGAVIVLSMKEIDYSLAQIARIIEGNDVKIISSYVTVSTEDPMMIYVTLKFNRSEISRVVASLERFQISIVERYLDDVQQDPNYDRLQQFFRYLDM